MAATTVEKPKLTGKEWSDIRAGRARLVDGVVVARPPRWKVGDVVTTRHAVQVKNLFLRRRWLFLLPGTRWVVTGVEDADRIDRRPTYTLKCEGGRWEIARREHRLRGV